MCPSSRRASLRSSRLTTMVRLGVGALGVVCCACAVEMKNVAAVIPTIASFLTSELVIASLACLDCLCPGKMHAGDHLLVVEKKGFSGEDEAVVRVSTHTTCQQRHEWGCSRIARCIPIQKRVGWW